MAADLATSSETFANFSQFQINGKPVAKLKVDELKQELIARGLEKSGLKKELQERLCQALAKEQSNTEEATEEKPGINDDETSIQEVSSTTTDVKETPSVVETEETPTVADTKESDGHGEVQEAKEKESLTNNEKSKDDKEVQIREVETTENKRNNIEEMEDGEITIQEDEKKDMQKSAVPEKRRRISLTRQTSNNPPTPGSRKRKWSSNKPKSSVVISTDSLKELIPGVQLASTPALEAVMELDDDKDEEEEGKDEKQPQEKKLENEESSNDKLDEKTPYKKRIVQVANTKTVKLGEAVNEADPDENGVGVATPIQPSDEAPTGAGSHDDNQSSVTPPSSETPTPVKREVSPPRNPPSCALHVSNLVRPFTQKQLLQYLSQFGAVTEEGFWINKIKSHCYVIYPSVDEATNARESLHGERWPATSPKTLRADFADNNKMLDDTDGALGKKIEEPAEERKEVVDEGKERSRSKEKTSQKHKDKKEEKKNEEPTAANLLDKLFRKTTATPCIYWLPLTNEQVVMREKEREERRKQRQLAMQEENKLDAQKPRDATRKQQEKPREMERPKPREMERPKPREMERPKPREMERPKPREMERPKPREMTRDQERRPLRGNRESSPTPRQRPDRRLSPVKRRSGSPAFRRAVDRKR